MTKISNLMNHVKYYISYFNFYHGEKYPKMEIKTGQEIKKMFLETTEFGNFNLAVINIWEV